MINRKYIELESSNLNSFIYIKIMPILFNKYIPCCYYKN